MEGATIQDSNKTMPAHPNLTLENYDEKVGAMAEFVDACATAIADRWDSENPS